MTRRRKSPPPLSPAAVVRRARKNPHVGAFIAEIEAHAAAITAWVVPASRALEDCALRLKSGTRLREEILRLLKERPEVDGE